MYTSIKQVNTAFRQHAKEQSIEIKRGKSQDDQITDTRLAYCNFIDFLHEQGFISDYLHQNSQYF